MKSNLGLFVLPLCQKTKNLINNDVNTSLSDKRSPTVALLKGIVLRAKRFLVNVNLLVCHTRNLVLSVECWVIEACGLDAGSLALEDTPE